MNDARSASDEPPDADEPAWLRRRGISGVLWNTATFGLSKAAVLVTTIILARLLDPSDFGLLAIGLVVIGYLDFVNDFGVSAAVIQSDDDPERTADTAFWLNLALGVALGLVGVGLAGPLAAFFSEPDAQPVIAALSLSFPLTSIGSIHEARLRRELLFRRRVVPELVKGVSKGAVSITMAVAGFGVWSLVWGQLAGTFVAAVAYWFAFPWLPGRRVDRATARNLLGFGSQMTLVGLLGGLHKNVDYLLIGRRLDTDRLGLYSIAFRLPQLLIESIVDVTGQVAFPMFSRVRRHRDRLAAGLRRMLALTGLVLVPLGVGLALIADPFVRIFYGDKWVDAIPVMQVLAIYMLVQSMSKNCGDVYKAMGRPGILNKLSIVKLAVTVPILVVAVPHGIVAVAVGQLISATVLTTIRLGLAARIVGTSFRSVATPFWPPVRAGLVMTGGCVVVQRAMDGAPDAAVLLATVATGFVAYLGTLMVLDRTAMLDHLRTIRPRRSASPPDREGV